MQLSSNIRADFFFGVRFRGNKYLTQRFRLMVTGGVWEVIINLLNRENANRQRLNIDTIPAEKRHSLRIDILGDVMESGIIRVEKLKSANATWLSKGDAYFVKHFHMELPGLWDDIYFAMEKRLEKYDEDVAAAAMAAAKKPLAAAGQLTSSIQASIRQLERVQSLVNRDLANLRHTEARLGLVVGPAANQPPV